MPVLSDSEVDKRLADLPAWRREGNALAREFKLSDFMGSVDLVNRIAPIAEEMQHHPDLSIAFNRVTVQLSTHSEGGITENDFELAKRIDSLA